jgi:exodeoxyribonuclease VII large subunit
MAPDPFRAEPGRLLAEATPGSNAPEMSVTELSGRLKRVVEGEFGHVRLRGEISGWKRAASGHAYLCLKDEGAVIDGVIWRGAAAALAFAPADGVEVIATGKLTTYPGRSKYQIVIDRMELAGEGALMALLEKLKARLAGEGLFEPTRKKPLPFLPRTIGVVTSPTGAVIRDILHRLADRCPTRVIVWPVKVQGDGAAAEIAAAVRGFDALPADGPVPRPDLVIVARGGGSIEDLWAFNEEVVVRAVAACTIPTICAVGHETDTSLSDHAADLRAPTPTAAAELAVPVRVELSERLAALGLRTGRCARRYHERGCERLTALVRVLPRRDAILGPQRQRTDDLAARLGLALERRLAAARRELDRAGHVLRPAMLDTRLATARARLDRPGAALGKALGQGVTRARHQLERTASPLRLAMLDARLANSLAALESQSRLLDAANPENLLARGYAWVESRTTGKVLGTAQAARGAGALRLHFRDGAIDARVERTGTKAYVAPEQPALL